MFCPQDRRSYLCDALKLKVEGRKARVIGSEIDISILALRYFPNYPVIAFEVKHCLYVSRENKGNVEVSESTSSRICHPQRWGVCLPLQDSTLRRGTL